MQEDKIPLASLEFASMHICSQLGIILPCTVRPICKAELKQERCAQGWIAPYSPASPYCNILVSEPFEQAVSSLDLSARHQMQQAGSASVKLPATQLVVPAGTLPAQQASSQVPGLGSHLWQQWQGEIGSC